jgi:hypothetical protein
MKMQVQKAETAEEEGINDGRILFLLPHPSSSDSLASLVLIYLCKKFMLTAVSDKDNGTQQAHQQWHQSPVIPLRKP